MANTINETHYVAHLKVERVEKTMPDLDARYGSSEKMPAERREVSEVTSVIIKGEVLERLLERLRGHIDLVEDE